MCVVVKKPCSQVTRVMFGATDDGCIVVRTLMHIVYVVGTVCACCVCACVCVCVPVWRICIL